MKEFQLGSYRLSVDVEATRDFYAARPLPWITCGCAGCRNFVRAVKTLPPPAEVCVDRGYGVDCLYGSWYHISGELLEGGPSPGRLYGEWLTLAEGVEAAFSPECHLPPEEFPRPCFQLNLEWRLPWLLEEENPYDQGC